MDRNILITGAASGIGAATALLLSEKDEKLILVDRSKERLKTLQEKIEQLGGESLIFDCDVSNEPQVEQVVDSAIQTYGSIDVLINNAGILDYLPAHEQETSDWFDVLKVNLLGTYLFSKNVVPHMRDNGSGHIVNVASFYSKIGTPNASAYCSSKFAVRGFSQSLLEENREYGIGVSLINPSTTNTGLFEGTKFRPDPAKALDPTDIAKTIQQVISIGPNALIAEVDIVPLRDPYS